MSRSYRQLGAALAAHGLRPRGGFAPDPDDAVPETVAGRPAAAVVLIGNAGAELWPHFAPFADEGPSPLDRWTQRVVGAIASRFGARPVYPFDEPPLPFQRWAMKAEVLRPSPLGVLIHPEHGLWHAYRAALLLAEPIDLPPPLDAAHPCDTCADKPCLSACPVGAFTGASYDVPACAAHLDAPAGAECLAQGCLARGACPVGTPYPQPQMAFHMAAFHRAISGR